jgi:crossover junction endodeoxyribonuclease RusA
MSTPRTITIADDTGRPLTMNDTANMHWRKNAKLVSEIRGRWWLLGLEHKVPRLTACTITVTPLHKDGRSPQDVGACCPAYKAALDGLVDAGMLTDDSPTYVHHTLFLPPRVCGTNGLELTITEVAA